MNQDFQIRHESKHYRPCNQYKHRFHYSHHRSLLGGWSVNESYSSFCRTWSTTHSPLVGMMIGVRLKLGFLNTLLIHEFVICQLLAGARIFFIVEKSSAFEKSTFIIHKYATKYGVFMSGTKQLILDSILNI